MDKLMIKILATAIFGIVLSGTCAGANLIENGSFENPPLMGNYEYVPGGSSAITGWQTALSGVERYEPAALAPFGISGITVDGQLMLDLNTDFAVGGGIDQTISTVSGQAYTLTFYEGTVAGFGRNGTANIVASAGSATNTFTVTNLSSTIAWTQYSLPFTASSSTTFVSFRNFDAPSQTFAMLDDISVVAIPEPAALFLALIGVGGYLASRGARMPTPLNNRFGR
jgi:hypothetical protein